MAGLRKTVFTHPLWRKAVGDWSDWKIRVPTFRGPQPGLHWIGPIMVVASLAVSWPAFSGALGEHGSSVRNGLFLGAVAILLMTWSFVLALRLRILEPLFGGLDSMYSVHRWTGVLAVAAMYLHVRVEPEVRNGILGAGKDIAETATDLAGTAETLFYVLIGISLLRLVPYRYWRWTHKSLGIPFAFASWHFYTASKPYANGSAWGWWFGIFMILGITAYALRVVGRDMGFRGVRYRTASVDHTATTTELTLRPAGKRLLRHRAGQFAFLKIQVPGVQEPHPFSIASSPSDEGLRFVIRDVGDWTRRLRNQPLLGCDVFVEGPYGRFSPLSSAKKTVWIAGGVGITPFLSALDGLPSHPGPRPDLFYAVRNHDDAVGLRELEAAAAAGLLNLRVYSSGAGLRLSADELAGVYGPKGLSGAHVGLCGPEGLIWAMDTACRELGAERIAHEDFDMRRAIGPDISVDLEKVVRRGR